MDDKNLKRKVIGMIKNSDQIDTFEISIVLMESIERVNSIVDEMKDEGIVVTDF
jgi:hypothetical protein